MKKPQYQYRVVCKIWNKKEYIDYVNADTEQEARTLTWIHVVGKLKMKHIRCEVLSVTRYRRLWENYEYR